MVCTNVKQKLLSFSIRQADKADRKEKESQDRVHTCTQQSKKSCGVLAGLGRSWPGLTGRTSLEEHYL